MWVSMTIHTVRIGDTIDSIADQYGMSVRRLILDNGLSEPYELVIGQAIVIAIPEQTYTVQEGDSLSSIAEINNITILQLLRNNPYLSDREYIFPGEPLVISYDNKGRKITTNGYANVFINRDTLRKTLPFLTYLSIFGNRTINNAELVTIDDEELILMAKGYGVAPIMMLSTLTLQGRSNYEAAYRILSSEDLSNKLIENILNTLKLKGYYGLNYTYLFINQLTQNLYRNFTNKLVSRLNDEGFPVFITFAPSNIFLDSTLTFERFDYLEIALNPNSITIMNYNWSFTYAPPSPVASISVIKDFLNYMIKQIEPTKIEVGFPLIGYNWELPFVFGVSKAVSLTLNSALTLAKEVNAVILFDEVSQTPFFEYTEYKNGIPRMHIVWFIDARSIVSLLATISDYRLKGPGFWNIMDFNDPLWVIINSQYEIETIFN
jgi:spore germination protein